MTVERDMGPTAAEHRAMLDDRQRELFDWMTSKITRDPKDAQFFGSLIQAVACIMPHATYWDLVSTAKRISEAPDFAQVRAAAETEAEINIKKPLEA